MQDENLLARKTKEELKQIAQVMGIKKISAMKKDVPVLLFAGDHDPVGNNGQGVRQVYKEIRAAGVRDVTLKLYEGGRHEMFNEINREEVYADLIGWLNSKLARIPLGNLRKNDVERRRRVGIRAVNGGGAGYHLPQR